MARVVYDHFITLTNSGQTLPFATLQVNNTTPNANLTQLYNSRVGGSILPNPITADSTGRVTFYLDAGRYTMKAVGSGGNIDYYDVNLPAEGDNLSFIQGTQNGTVRPDMNAYLDGKEQPDYAAMISAHASVPYLSGDTVTITASGISGDGVVRVVANHGKSSQGDYIVVLDTNTYWQRSLPKEYISQSGLVSDSIIKSHIQRAAQFDIAGSVSILGDSITVGVGATDISNSYASYVQRALADKLNGGYGYDNEVNFDWSSMGNVALSGQSAGTAGPIQRSQIISVGGTITITRPNATKMAFFYEQKTGAGKVEVRQNAVLLDTVDCSGADTSNVLSAYVDIAAGGSNVQFLVIDAPVEFLAIVPIADNANQPNVMMNMRMAVSGWNTTDFLQDPAQLISIGTVGAIGTADSVYVLALGTNDIYTEARSPVEYTDNLRIIGTTLKSYRQSNVIVLIVPPVAGASINPAIPAYAHEDYRRALYELSFEQNWPIIDYTQLQLENRALYVDDLHPNDRGHQEMAAYFCAKFGMNLQSPVTGETQRALDAKSDAVLYRSRADLTTFTGTTIREKTLTSMGVTPSDFITGIYLRWKTSGVMIAYNDCQDLAGGTGGLQIMRSFSGADYSVAKIFYSSPSNDGEGFAAPVGPLSASIIAGYTDVEVIVEFERSLNIQSI